jgi:ankyrin repeat protein
MAIYMQNLPLVTELIAHGAALDDESLEMHDMSSDGRFTALHWAVISRTVELVRTLLLAGANIKARTPRGMTPLHLAVDADLVSMTSLLLAHGADVNVQDDNGQKPLDFAKVEQIAIMLTRADLDITLDVG